LQYTYYKVLLALLALMDKLTIFVVEDDEWYRELINYNLNLNPDYEVHLFASGKEVLDVLHKKPDLVTLDYRLPDMDGAEVLKRIKQQSPEVEVIMISEQEKIDTAVELLKLGAYDYLVKTRDIRDRLLNTINHVRKNRKLRARINQLEKEVSKKYSFQNTIIGQSEPIKKVFRLIEKAILTNITVTIAGETGTGKELVAKAIHYNSGRAKAPFVAVNMAAIPKDLAESELFGHEKGSFTGANARRIGKFEEANEGTLFLDEIGEMDLTLQAKLLRALQEKEIIRVGSNMPVKTNCRIIVATHRNLAEEVRQKRFREDLYFRLFGLTIEMPPLRERDKDIVILADHFIKNFSKDNGLPERTLSREARMRLMKYPWPGNVRELRSVVELAVVMANGDTIEEGDIEFGPEAISEGAMNYEMSLKDHTRRIMKAYLKKYNDNIKLAAQKLDIGYSTIYRMLRDEKGGTEE